MVSSTGLPSHILLMGPPGSGKSTLGHEVAGHLGLAIIDLGDMLRAEAASGSAIGHKVDSYLRAGDLAPSKLVARVLDKRLAMPDAQRGFILDGYGRQMDDVLHLLDWVQKANVHDLAIIGLHIPTAEVLRRVKGRRVCGQGHDVNIDLQPPTHKGHCDVDGSVLKRRPDDAPKVVAHRMQVYHQETEPVIKFLKSKGLYQEIDATGTPAQVQKRLMAMLATLSQHAPALAASASNH